MLPSPALIELGLSAATERFAAELVEPQLDAPAWTDFEWQMARAAAVLHGVTPLLATTLRWSGPAGWQAFVQEQHRQTLLRYHRIALVLKNIDDRAQAQGLAIVALKGAALHALGVYAPGGRPMADIDLLVRPADAGRAAQILVSLGYLQTGAVWKHGVFEPGQTPAQVRALNAATLGLPPGEHEDYPIKVDLHTRIAERLPLSETDITERVFPDEPRAGLNGYASRHALLLHLLLHAAGNLCGRIMRLMHLHDLALLASQMIADEWQRLFATQPGSKAMWWALPPLELLNRYHPGLVPMPVLAALGRDCPRALRQLSRRMTLPQASLVSLSIPAFPGMPWCGSTQERVRYMRRRLFPGPEQRAARQLTATEQWAVQQPWVHQSQGRRALRWLVARPPRHASMYIVRAVLESPLKT
jgi:hypothetical protein